MLILLRFGVFIKIALKYVISSQQQSFNCSNKRVIKALFAYKVVC